MYFVTSPTGNFSVSLTVTGPGGATRRTRISYINVAKSITLNLNKGWNMISVPGDPAINDVPTLISGKPILDYGKIYDPKIKSFIQTSTLKFGEGYFIGTNAEIQLSIDYYSCSPKILQLKYGWNQIGGLSCNVPISSLIVSPPNKMLPYFKWWDPTTKAYIQVDTMEPGKGYFIGVDGDCSVTINESPASPPKQHNISKTTKPLWESILSIKTQENQKDLFFGMHSSASDSFDMSFDDPIPPLPDFFDNIEAGWLIKNSIFQKLNRSIIREDTESELELFVELSEMGELIWRDLPKSYSCLLLFGGNSVDMHEARLLSLPAGRHLIKILLSKKEIPKKTRLLANYPNPFNPETWIPFELSVDSRVEIMIYSSSGKLVRSLNLGYKPAGKYIQKSKAAYWDGKNESGEDVGSGVYFCTLVTPDISQTEKIVIVR